MMIKKFLLKSHGVHISLMEKKLRKGKILWSLANKNYATRYLQGFIRQGCARQRMFFKLLLKVVLTLTSRE